METGCGDARWKLQRLGAGGGAGLAEWKPPLSPRPPVLNGAGWAALEGREQGHEGRASCLRTSAPGP